MDLPTIYQQEMDAYALEKALHTVAVRATTVLIETATAYADRAARGPRAGQGRKRARETAASSEASSITCSILLTLFT